MKLFVGSLFAFVAAVALVGCGEPAKPTTPAVTPSPEAMNAHKGGDPAKTDEATPAVTDPAKTDEAAPPAVTEPVVDPVKVDDKKEEPKEEAK